MKKSFCFGSDASRTPSQDEVEKGVPPYYRPEYRDAERINEEADVENSEGEDEDRTILAVEIVQNEVHGCNLDDADSADVSNFLPSCHDNFYFSIPFRFCLFLSPCFLLFPAVPELLLAELPSAPQYRHTAEVLHCSSSSESYCRGCLRESDSFLEIKTHHFSITFLFSKRELLAGGVEHHLVRLADLFLGGQVFLF